MRAATWLQNALAAEVASSQLRADAGNPKTIVEKESFIINSCRPLSWGLKLAPMGRGPAPRKGEIVK
jgi:hypothetical protein